MRSELEPVPLRLDVIARFASATPGDAAELLRVLDELCPSAERARAGFDRRPDALRGTTDGTRSAWGYGARMAAGLPVASSVSVSPDGRRALLLSLGTLALACMAISLAAALQTPTRPDLVAAARVSMVGVPVAVGLYAWYTRLNERFGLLLVAAGGGWFVTTLAESSDEVLYTLGRTAGWLVEVLLVYLFLAFPSGRLTARADRLLAAATGVTVLALFLPRLLLAERFEVPSQFTSCVRDCPRNALFAFGREPAALDAVVRPLGVVLVLVLMIAVILRLRERMREATPLTRRVLTPVLAIASVRAGLLAVAILARWIDPTPVLLHVTAWLLALAVPLIALAFLAGLVRWRLFAGRALERMAECLRARPDVTTLRGAFAEAFEDPSVEIAFPSAREPRRWMDAHGRPLALPEPGTGLSVSALTDGGAPVAAIVHDQELCAHPELLRAGLEMAGVVLENQRLAAEAEAAMREVSASRARIVAGAERERRRIERDLHDGAQQRLVALRIELELAEELVRRDPERSARLLRRLEGEVDEALEELRALAHGVYPPLLADHGLPEALRAVVGRFAIPARLAARGVGRHPPEVEAAVYFCVLEALQNVLKHARGARRVDVELDGQTAGELRLCVRDDGAGFAGAVRDDGDGVANMRDRLVALGGELTVSSAPGAGTLVRGWVPTVSARG
jgi:signal transduction histidine kinase